MSWLVCTCVDLVECSATIFATSKGKVTHEPQEAHTAGAYPGFCSMKQLRRLLPPPPLGLVIFAFFFAIRKTSSHKNKITANFFFRKNLLHCRNDIQKYWFEGENAIGNSVDNTSSCTLVIVVVTSTSINPSYIPMLFDLYFDYTFSNKKNENNISSL